MKSIVEFGGVGILSDARLRRYYVAVATAGAGSALTAVALPLVVFDRTGDALMTALVPVLQVTPTLLFGLVAGALADRFRRRTVMVVGAAAAAAVMAALAAAAFAETRLGEGGLVAATLVAAAGVYTATVFSEAASFAAVPTLVGRERVVAAQTLLQTTNRVTMLAVPATAAALYGVVGPGPLFAVGAALFAVSVAVLAGLDHRHLDAAGARRARRGLGADIADGLRYLWRHRLIRSLAAIGACNAVAGGVIAGVLLVYADRAFGLAPRDAGLSAFYVAAGLGSLVGGAALPPLRRRLPVVTVTLLLVAASAGCLAVVALAPYLAVAVAAYGIWQGLYWLVVTNGQALRMQILPDEYQSRVGAAARMLGWGGVPVGALLAGVLAGGGVPVRVVVGCAVAALAAAVVLAARTRAALAAADLTGAHGHEPRHRR